MEINTQKIRITFFFALLAVAFSFCQNNASTITTQKSVVKDSIQTKPTAVQVEDTTHDFNHGKAYIVEQIIITSPTFLKITRGLAERVIKNGGNGFGISMDNNPEFEPNGTEDHTETYIFELHETYPDRNVTIARFSFDPKKRQLFRYDGVNDTWNAIDFDKRWLVKFDEYDK